MVVILIPQFLSRLGFNILCVIYFVLFAFFLNTCVTMDAAAGWPVTTYSPCNDLFMMPDEPTCLVSARVSGGIKYQDEFDACRQSVDNYVRALNEWYICVMDELHRNYNLYLEQSKKTISCLNSQIPEGQLKNTTVNCPIVDVIIDKHSNLTSYEVAPFCIGKSAHFPGNRFRLEKCTEEVLNYLKNMKDEINSATWGLKQRVNNAADDVIRKFNCYARGESYCP